jgi:hypothetical protein
MGLTKRADLGAGQCEHRIGTVFVREACRCLETESGRRVQQEVNEADALRTGQLVGERMIREKWLARCSVQGGQLAGNCGISAVAAHGGTGAGQEERGTGLPRWLHLASAASTGAIWHGWQRRGHTTAVVLILMHLTGRLGPFCGLTLAYRRTVD